MATEPTVQDTIRFAAVPQVLIVLLTSIILDGGVLMGPYLRGLTAFWAGIAWMLWRCRGRLNRLQMAVIRLGWIPIILLAVVVLGFGQRLWEILGIIPY